MIISELLVLRETAKWLIPGKAGNFGCRRHHFLSPGCSLLHQSIDSTLLNGTPEGGFLWRSPFFYREDSISWSSEVPNLEWSVTRWAEVHQEETGNKRKNLANVRVHSIVDKKQKWQGRKDRKIKATSLSYFFFFLILIVALFNSIYFKKYHFNMDSI